jgi:curved DNA-binding protein CbpA
MDITTCYTLLNVTPSSTDEEISRSFKKLALRYHPDKNLQRVAWATEAMSRLNNAYASVMSHRFRNDTDAHDSVSLRQARTTEVKQKRTKDYLDPGILTNQFIQLRESAKDALYRYFQYNLHNIPIREKVSNQAIFNKIVFTLRKTYHAIRALKLQTDDPELLEHFDIFNSMIFNFYRASECLNIIDSYNNQYDVEAYRIYREGDELLHQAHRELFYDRHNRGYFKKSMAYTYLNQSLRTFQANLKVFQDSSWAVETGIKLDYAKSLLAYIQLFFSEE